jgi:hypothetical protein
MIAEARYVFDVNVIVSALLFEQSVPGQAFYAAIDRGHILPFRGIGILTPSQFLRFIEG